MPSSERHSYCKRISDSSSPIPLQDESNSHSSTPIPPLHSPSTFYHCLSVLRPIPDVLHPLPLPTPTPPLSPDALNSAFSFLPSLHNLLHSLQFSTDPRQTHQACEALLSHFTRAHALLQTLPAITVSAAEQQRRYQQLLAMREAKRALARRYGLLPLEDEGGSGGEGRGGPALSVKREKEEDGAVMKDD